MYTVKYEIYRNENNRQTNLTKTFNSLDDLGKWLIDHATPYKPKSDTTAWSYLFVWDDTLYKINKSLGDYLISRNHDEDSDIWVYLVTTEDGIVYSGGKYTNGIQHMSKAFMDFCKKLQHDYEHPTFNFID